MDTKAAVIYLNQFFNDSRFLERDTGVMLCLRYRMTLMIISARHS